MGRSTINYESLVRECDSLIRSGAADKALGILSRLKFGAAPREWIAPIAKLFRRTGRPDLGIPLMAKVIYPRGKDRNEPSPTELAEYSMLLYRVGAFTEAVRTIAKVNATIEPEALHYRALMHITTWEFDEAAVLLTKYLQSNPAEYDALLGRVNLSLALVESGNAKAALPLIDENTRICQEAGYSRLLCLSLAHRAQLHIQTKEYSEAATSIAWGEKALEQGSTTDRLTFVRWKLILEGLRRSDTGPISQLKALAYKQNNWDYVRVADLYSLKISFDESRFLYLLFGTPMASFRRRLFSDLGRTTDRESFRLGPKNSPRFDLLTGEIDGEPDSAPPSQCHQLIEVMLRDFYQPLRIPGLFSELFPNDHFDIGSSPTRTHATIKRTRAWLKENRIPIEIQESGGFYRLKTTGLISLQIPLHRQPVDTKSVYFRKLQFLFLGVNEFSAAEARSRLGLSRQSIQALINWGLRENRLERIGEKNDVRYRFSEKQSVLQAA